MDKYAYKLLALILTSIFGIGLFNLLIDPLGIYQVLSVEGVNSNKTEKFSMLGIVKAAELETGNYDALLMGTSRVLFALNPNHPDLSEFNAYNMGLKGPHIVDLVLIASRAIKRKSIKTIVLELGFRMFSSEAATADTADRAHIVTNLSVLDHIENTLDRRILRASIRTITASREQHSNKFYFNGLLEPPDHFTRAPMRDVFDRNLRIVMRQYVGFRKYGYDLTNTQLLADLLRQCRDRGIVVKLYFSPVHAMDLETVRITGQWGVYERWKRDVVNAVEREAGQNGRETIQLWDFSGYNSITTEPIPDDAGSDRRMKWYLDSHHYTEDVGNMIITRMFSTTAGHPEVPDDFGVLVRNNNIETHLKRIQTAREAFAKKHSYEIQKLEAIYERKLYVR